MDRLWRSNYSISSRTGCPLGIVNDEDHKVESCGATALMCLHGTKSKNFKKNILSMADVSLNDNACFDYYSNASCLYRKTTKERDNDKSVDPNFTPINNFNYVNQLRVLTVSNENFEVDLVPLYDEFMLSKNQIKRKYFQNNFDQSEKNRVKSKWLEKNETIEKTYFIF